MEVWKPVPGYEGRYSVSSQGRVRSESRVQKTEPGKNCGHTRIYKGMILSTGVSAGRYPSVVLGKTNGKSNGTYVHVLVALAFLGPAPKGKEVCHRDDVPWNNSVENIYYGTRSENLRDRYANQKKKVTWTN